MHATAIAGVMVSGVPRAQNTQTQAARPASIIWGEVSPRFRRRHAGRALLDAVLEEWRRRDMRECAVEVEGVQVEALGLFRGAGFMPESQTLDLVLPPEGAARLFIDGTVAARIRPLRLNDVNHLGGLLIHLGVERSAGPHDDLPAFTPREIVDWLQRDGTVAVAAWEPADSTAPLGLAWATRTREETVLRFLGVHDDSRRQGIGRALLAALVDETGSGAAGVPAGNAARAGVTRSLAARLLDPGPELEFFRRLGFEARRITWRLVKPLAA